MLRTTLALTALLLAPAALAADTPPLPAVDVPLATGTLNPKDYAVIVGIEDYFALPDVPFASRDAVAFEQFALKSRGIPSARVVALVGRASRAQIRKALEDAGKATLTGGTVWVYFAGHGAAHPTTRERMFLPAETPQDELGFADQGIAMSEVEKLVTAGGAQIVLLADACYTGAGRGGGDLLGDGKRLAVPASAKAPERGASWLAAGENQAASPLPPAEHGAFTYAMLGALRGWADGAVDGVRDGKVTSEEASTYVQGALLRLGITDQQPRWNGPALTLVSGGKLENAPELPRVITGSLAPKSTGGPSVAAAPKVAILGGGSVSLSDFDRELVEQMCVGEALKKGPEIADGALDASEAEAKRTMSARWGELAKRKDFCLGLATVDLRAPCIGQVQAFLKDAGSLAVERSQGTQVVAVRLETSPVGKPVDCGTREVKVPSVRRTVTVAEVGDAERLLAALQTPPATTSAPRPTPTPTPAPVAAAAPATGPLAAGERVQITAVDPADAFYGSRGDYVGHTCSVDSALTDRGSGFYGGSLTCDGASLFFYKVGLARAGGGVAVDTTGHHTGPLRSGARFRVVDVHTADAYYDDRDTKIGLTCTAGADMTENEDGGWYGGPVTCDGGESAYFYAARVLLLDAPTAAVTSGYHTGALTSGTRFRVVDIHPEDAYYDGRDAKIGLTCTAGADLDEREGGGWYGGPATCDNGESPYFYAARVVSLGAAPDVSVARHRGPVRDGVRVRIVAVDSSDAYYDDRDDIVGAICTTDGEQSEHDDGWYSGSVDHCSNGKTYYFYAAGYEVVGR